MNEMQARIDELIELLNSFVTIQQIADHAELSKSAIHYHLGKGAFPSSFQVGTGATALTLVPWEEVEHWKPGKPTGRPKLTK